MWTISFFSRNPDGEERAWCYTTDPNQRWQYCAVDECDGDENSVPQLPDQTDCGTTEFKQIDYRGTQSVTENGLECMRWDQQSPHTHTVTAEKYPEADLRENYCR